MNTPHILFIGGGNMTRAIVGALVSDGYPSEALIALYSIWF